MLKKVLVAVDGSAHAKRAVTFAAEIAHRFDAQLVLMHVMRHQGSDNVPDSLKELEHIEHIRVTEADMLRNVAQSIVSEAHDLAGSVGKMQIEDVVLDGDPASRIVAYCAENDVDLVVLGRRGLGSWTGLLMGSVSQKVSTMAPCACVIVPTK